MIKKLFIMLLLSLCLHGGTAARGQEILVLQSARFSPYEEGLKGFKSICQGNITRVVISELKHGNIKKEINEINPHLIIAIGMDALIEVKNIRDIPIIYCMVLNPRLILSGEKNFTGVSMNISPERQLNILSKAMPDIKRFGLAYDPARTDTLVKKLQKAAAKTGTKIIANEVHRRADVPTAIKAMEGKVDALWMIPDTTVITPETVEFMLLFSIENKTPILTFSEKYLALGALISISAEPFDMGSRAGELANRILSGKQYWDEEETYVREETITLNLKVARKLGITIDEKNITEAKIIE